jgi:hypothetical protein
MRGLLACFLAVISFVSVLVVPTRSFAADGAADADGTSDADRLGVRARVAIPVAVLSYSGGEDRPAGGLCFGLGVRGLSRFTSRARGLVFEDGLDLTVTGSPLRGVSTGGGFTWRYGAELGVRGAKTGVLLGASVDTMGWAFNGGVGFTSAAVPTSLRVELQLGSDMRGSATAFATVLPLGARRYGGEVRVELWAKKKELAGGGNPGLVGLAFYASGSDTGGQTYLPGGTRLHGSMALGEIGVIESFR